MENTIKTFETFILQLVSQFEYSDFQPEINPLALKEKLSRLLSEKNAFWDILAVPENWQNWLFIQVKSFKPWDAVQVGFLCHKRELTLIAFDELNGARFHKEYLRHEIDLIETWTNHKHLFDGFCNVILAAINFANRLSTEDTFEEIYKSMSSK